MNYWIRVGDKHINFDHVSEIERRGMSIALTLGEREVIFDYDDPNDLGTAWNQIVNMMKSKVRFAPKGIRLEQKLKSSKKKKMSESKPETSKKKQTKSTSKKSEKSLTPILLRDGEIPIT